MAEDECVDPEAIASTSAYSTLAIETKLFVANPDSNINRQTFLRFINPNEDAVAIEIYGIDDDGNFSASGAVSFNLDGGAAKQIAVQDLGNGDADEGLTGYLCDGQGKWELHVRSDETVEVMGLIRTPDGFLTSLTDVVPQINGVNHAYFVNPASNTSKQTFLRVVNTSSESGQVTISGVDNEGHNAYAINPATLERDDENRTIIYPKHAHKALRRHLGLENTAVDEAFQFTNTEDFEIFS